MLKPKVLIIDFDKNNVNCFEELLKIIDPNIQVHTCSTFSLSRELVIKILPDIIIFERQRLENGFLEVIQSFKQNTILQDIPILLSIEKPFLSSDVKLALEIGILDFIYKPFEINELMVKINVALKLSIINKENDIKQKLIEKIKINKHLSELELIKKELLSKTMVLLQMNKLHEQFYENVNTTYADGCAPDCIISVYVKSHAKDMINFANKQIWNELETNFEIINQEFFKILSIKFNKLSSNELKLCAYLRLNLNTKDISSITKQSIRSIEIARTRLREKFGLKGSDINLHTFLLEL